MSSKVAVLCYFASYETVLPFASNPFKTVTANQQLSKQIFVPESILKIIKADDGLLIISVASSSIRFGSVLI